ncbi:hypothetical protein Ahia01_001205900, partial [Argonauta hians]
MSKGCTWRRRRRRRRRKRKETDQAATALFDCRYVDLLHWMRTDRRFKPPSLSPRHFPETGRGLMAMKSLGPGDTLISVPADLIITTSLVLNSDVAPFIKRCRPPMSAQAALAVFLLCERAKGEHSRWGHYISMLPSHFDSALHWQQAPVTVTVTDTTTDGSTSTTTTTITTDNTTTTTTADSASTTTTTTNTDTTTNT